jgi:hypothetical protein
VKILTILCVMGLAPAILAAADAPYIGKWKLNVAKSQLTGETLTLEKTSSGMIRESIEGVSYEFKLDGKEYPTPYGGTLAMKEISPDTWEATVRVKGKVVETMKMVTKGDAMTMKQTVNKPDGGTVPGTSAWKRASGGPGFFGKWMSTEVRAPVSMVEIAANGTDGITINYPEFGFTVTAKFDGKDYPASGQFASPKNTFVFKTTGPRSFEMTSKIDGKATYADTFTVSADGKTLTDDGTPITAREPIKAVFDRQ